MTSSAVVAAIQKEYLLGKDLLQQGATFGAMAALGGVTNVIVLLEPRDRAYWEARLRAVQLSSSTLAQTQLECDREIKRLIGILSVGESWELEELVLVLTSRVQLDLVSEVLSLLGHSIDIRVSDLDHLIRKVAASNRNASIYMAARQRCALHWGLPIESPWLGTRRVVSRG